MNIKEVVSMNREVKAVEFIDNKEVARIIDLWNFYYEYSLYYSDEMDLIRVDNQENTEELTSILEMVSYYIEQIENKLSYQEIEAFRGDLYTLIDYENRSI